MIQAGLGVNLSKGLGSIEDVGERDSPAGFRISALPVTRAGLQGG
jgi:hypothetical protein